MASSAAMSREPATTVTSESATVTFESTTVTKSAVTASKVVSIMIPSAAVTPSAMMPIVMIPVTPTVSTVVWMAPAVAVGRISTAITVAAVIFVVAALSRN
jgi:hypothetical protein